MGRIRPPAGSWSRLAPALVAVGLAVTLLPILIATARGIDRGWLPAGDNALTYVRTTDVFSDNPPLLYTWSFASTSAEADFNHPGPLLFDFFALPTALFGMTGLAIGAAVLNAAALVGIVGVARRRGGPLLAAVALAATATLCWTMGSELLYDPWSPNSLLLPFLLFLLLVWSASGGDLLALPLVAGVGSFLLETNLSYGLLVPLLSVWAVVGLVLDLRRRRRNEPNLWPTLRRQVQRTWMVTALVLVACWVQPLIEQFTGPGDGNLTRIASGLSGVTSTLGPRNGLRLIAGVTTLPPWWLRPSMGEIYSSLPSFGVALASLGALAVVLGLCAWDASRRRDRVASSAVATAVLAALLGLATVTRSPVDEFGILSPYQTRLLWPLAAFVAFAVAVALARRLAGSTAWSMACVGALSIITTAVALLNLPYALTDFGTHEPAFTRPVLRDLNRQLGPLEEAGTLFYDWELDSFYSQFYGPGVLAELDRRGVPFVFDEEFLLRTLGEHRRSSGERADAVLLVRTGDRAYEPPRRGEMVALHEGLSTQEKAELLDLKEDIGEYIATGRLRLNDRGRQVLEGFAAGEGDGSSNDDGLDAEELLGSSRGLLGLFRQDFLELDDEWRTRFDRYELLQEDFDSKTVAVFLAPLD